VLEEFFGIMVKLTKDAMTPGSIAGEIFDAHERGEIPRPPLRGNITALREPGQSASRTRNAPKSPATSTAQVTAVIGVPPASETTPQGAVSDLSFIGHTNEKAL
jgi:hypothetical protein